MLVEGRGGGVMLWACSGCDGDGDGKGDGVGSGGGGGGGEREW